jgi:hypothetical protein
MIAAGAAVVRQFDPRFEDEECVAADVFQAMVKASAEREADCSLPQL